MEAQNYIDLGSSLVKFCVSFVCVNVAYHGLSVFVEAWNCHPIAGLCILFEYNRSVLIFYSWYPIGGGTPSSKATERLGTTRSPPGVLPTGAMAKQQYEAQGGNITPFGEFGADPLRNRQDLVNRRDGLFAEQNPPFSILFSDVISGNGNHFRDGILNFITITRLLEQLL